MHKPPLLTSNFAHLQEHDEQLLRLGMLAERYFPDDPNTSLLKLRQLAELLAQLVATQGRPVPVTRGVPVRPAAPPAGPGHSAARDRPALR